VVEVRVHLLRVLAAPGERRKGSEDKGKKRNFAWFLRESARFSRGGGSIPLELLACAMILASISTKK
jgi:hypothetical protein